jgi:hypothetical protein
MRPILFLTAMFILVSGISAQKKEIKKALSDNTWQGAHRIAYSEKGLFEDEIQSYCRENGFVLISSTKKKFFVYGKNEQLVTSFLFLTSEEYYNQKELETYNAARSSRDYLSYINSFPNGKHITEIRELEKKREYDAYVSSINTRNYKSYFDNFPNGIHYDELLAISKTYDSQLHNTNSLTDLIKLMQVFPHNKNEIEIKAYDYINKDAYTLKYAEAKANIYLYMKKVPKTSLLHIVGRDSIFCKSWSSYGPEGHGLKWNSDETYFGGFSKGKYQGWGIYNGSRLRPEYWGDEILKEHFPDYKVTIKGEWIDGLIHHHSTESYKAVIYTDELLIRKAPNLINGQYSVWLRYWGDFKSGKFEGFGVFTFCINDNPISFSGDFVDGRPNGFFSSHNGLLYCKNVNSFDDLYDCDNQYNEDYRRAKEISNSIACSKCEIDDSKTEIPENTTDLWGATYQFSGKIVMKNGDYYPYYFKKGKWVIEEGFIFINTTEFDTYDDLRREFLDKCINMYCR